MKLTKTIQAINDFEESLPDIIWDEICQLRYDLPLEDFCKNGGWPDHDSLYVEIKKTNYNDNNIYVEFSVEFNAAIQTSCPDVTMPEPAFGILKCAIDKKTGEAKWIE